jgi:hypothetical protein
MLVLNVVPGKQPPCASHIRRSFSCLTFRHGSDAQGARDLGRTDHSGRRLRENFPGTDCFRFLIGLEVPGRRW